jgi:tRNA threonylcarbamoyladenosine biosynthesis protein TsaB
MILAIDTATRQVSLALATENTLIGQAAWPSANTHTASLAPGVERLLSDAGARLNDLTALAVAIGPGSFTGVRIGLAFAKGMALACSLPLAGVKTLDIVMKGLPPSEAGAIAVIPAGRGRVVWAPYAAREMEWVAAHDGVVGTWEEVAGAARPGARVTGEIDDTGRQVLARHQIQVESLQDSDGRARWLAAIGWERWRRGQLDTAATLAPIYAHPPGSGSAS